MNSTHPIILASSSPRRQFLLREAGLSFKVVKPESDESFPADMPPAQVAKYLASKKAEMFRLTIRDEVLITADTVVIHQDQILNKPADEAEAFEMLKKLSGKTHTVMTGVCLLSAEKEISFDDTSLVSFVALNDEEIRYYIKNYKPFDKAGAYGAQDWIGMVGIEKIEGSYFNVMGLPMHRLYQELKKFGIHLNS
ncbi:MAG TPA: Maf family nucleotide pyrophosphatase [Cyclobacteriaceae bacterium]|nr:Maf family nucleotide pyrophosphatase [Cyclobacteriaceae bacterium]